MRPQVIQSMVSIESVIRTDNTSDEHLDDLVPWIPAEPADQLSEANVEMSLPDPEPDESGTRPASPWKEVRAWFEEMREKLFNK